MAVLTLAGRAEKKGTPVKQQTLHPINFSGSGIAMANRQPEGSDMRFKGKSIRAQAGRDAPSQGQRGRSRTPDRSCHVARFGERDGLEAHVAHTGAPLQRELADGRDFQNASRERTSVMQELLPVQASHKPRGVNTNTPARGDVRARGSPLPRRQGSSSPLPDPITRLLFSTSAIEKPPQKMLPALSSPIAAVGGSTIFSRSNSGGLASRKAWNDVPRLQK